MTRFSRSRACGLHPFLVALVAACARGTEEACTAELGIYLAPPDTTVRVGDSYQARAGLTSCGGRQREPDIFTWTPANPAIARVDSTGRVTAVAPGETTIAVAGTQHGSLGVIRVVVQGSAP